MCGVFGMSMGYHGNPQSDLNFLKLALEHRGPDDWNIEILGGIGIGHCRLAIQDPTNSSQPMRSQSGKSLISYNGEIYNLNFLREKLPGFTWKTNGDTELVLELIEKFGIKILSEIEGMFAIAFFSVDSNELFLARDQMGEKPLYYRFDKKGEIAFSSEANSLATVGGHSPKIDLVSLRHYLKYMYIPADRSIYNEIKTVIPGSFIKWNKLGFSMGRYVDFNPQLEHHSEPLNPSHLRAMISSSVQKTLVADVGIGVMLSGGMDSSIVAFEATSHLGKINTYSVVFDDNDGDAIYSRMMANELQSSHNEIRLDEMNIDSIVYETLSKLPQPFGDNSIIPTYLLAKEAGKNVKVLLSGDGADELFAGYRYFNKYVSLKRDPFTLSRYQFRKNRLEIARHLPTKKLHEYSELFAESRIQTGRLNPFEAWNVDISLLTDSEIDLLTGVGPSVTKHPYSDPGEYRGRGSILVADQLSYLPGDILVKSDLGGMLASVEIRAPFLSKEIVSASRLASELHYFKRKELLKKAYWKRLPQSILERRKQGFGAPIEKWLNSENMKILSGDLLANQKSKIYGFLDYTETQKLVGKNSLIQWNLMSLAIWMESNNC
jgi:asparagine synthase (glutamine-hydrolysing)